MKLELNLNSERARKARLGAVWGFRSRWLAWITLFLLAAAGLLFTGGLPRLAYFVLAVGLAWLMFWLWYARELAELAPLARVDSLDDILDGRLLGSIGTKLPKSAKDLAPTAAATPEGQFVCLRLLIAPKTFEGIFTEEKADIGTVWRAAEQLRQQESSAVLDGAAGRGAPLTATAAGQDFLARNKLSVADAVETYGWSARLTRALRRPRPFFGGLGRDWAAGYTPKLEQFGENISRYVESGQGHFHTLAHADILETIAGALSKQNAVALVGDVGTGKTSTVYALAERLLAGKGAELPYYQIFELNSSQIISSAGGNLERIILDLLNEAVHARNVILFLDEAELFFGEGTGAFDAGKLLLPVLQNRGVKIITAWTPDNFQQLKAKDANIAAQFMVINIGQPDQATSMKIAEDAAQTFEARENKLVSFEAVKEAYRLSDQYSQELAFPGKVISLLEQAMQYADGQIVKAQSVKTSLEKSKGIKVSEVAGAESETLLHLEDKIHARMINQERAVKVVSEALRRGRAGVGSPKRPIGSFLFLGPTGVGKTELVRSLAAVYFGDERQMIRLDMSEYQQPQDVSRLLDASGQAGQSLIMRIREQSFSTVLLDEIEKAHPNILNLLLQLLDEGQLTDTAGKPAIFRNAIIVATSNAGSAEISQMVARGESLEKYEKPLIDSLISRGQFKAEIINRFDEIVLFRPLNMDELGRVAGLLLAETNHNLAKQNINVKLTPAALQKVVQSGYDPQFGARPMRRAMQEMVESVIADRILKGEAKPGDEVTLDAAELGKAGG